MAATQASMSQGAFPAELEQVPLTDRVPEVFGWMPYLIGGTLLFSAVLLPIMAPPTGTDSFRNYYWGTIAGAAIVGVLLLYYEVRRRRNRTVLVPREELIGIYRRRKLVQEISANQVTHYRLSWSNTFSYLFIPVLLTFGLLFAAMAPQKQPAVDGSQLAALAGSLLMLTASISLIRTRILCRHFYIPKGRRKEEILLTRGEASRVFSSTR